MQDRLKFIWHRLTSKGSACDRYETLISLYADGMATDKEMRLARAHLAACPECNALFSSIRVTTGALADRPAPDAPTGLSERLRLAIAQERAREEARMPVLVPRAPARSLAPKLVLAGTLATLVIAAALVHDLHFSPQNTHVAINPGHSASNSGPLTQANHGTPAIVSSTKKLASATGATGKHAVLSTILHKGTNSGEEPIQPTRSEIAQANTAPHLGFVIDHHSPVNHTPRGSNLVAAAPSRGAGANSLAATHPAAPHLPTNDMVATMPHSSSIDHSSTIHSPITHPDVHPQLPPAVNNPATGEQPTMVAVQPPTQPTPAAPEDSPRVRLASRLHLIADSSAQAAQQMAKVAVNSQRRTDYSGSLEIVGSSIR